MKTAYIDCMFGVSGDMILGSLVACGVPIDYIASELSKLHVDGFELKAQKVMTSGLTAVHVDVITEHQHEHRHLSHIRDIIYSGSLSDQIKDRAFRIFNRLAEAEATVHGTTPEKIHFHEVGALDAIVDVVGACIGLDYLSVDTLLSTPLHLGTGSVQCAHGLMPVPVPAVMELTKGIPVVRTSIDGEITTPSGAAIVTTLVSSYSPAENFVVDTVGYGAGTKVWDDHPNVLRLSIGEISDKSDSFDTDHCILIETNIDDMNPEFYGYLTERLLAAGALDVYLTSINMKKGRPGTILSVLSSDTQRDMFVRMILRETTSLGVRMLPVTRKKLIRESKTVDSEFGPVRIKVATIDGHERYTPEYEDCARIARDNNLPIHEVYETIQKNH